MELWVRKLRNNSCPWQRINRGQRKKGAACTEPMGQSPTQQTGCIAREASSSGASWGLEKKALSCHLPMWSGHAVKFILSGWGGFCCICSAPGGRHSQALDHEAREGDAGGWAMGVTGICKPESVLEEGRRGHGPAGLGLYFVGSDHHEVFSSKNLLAIVLLNKFPTSFPHLHYSTLCIMSCALDVYWNSHCSPRVFTWPLYFLSCLPLCISIICIDTFI